MHSEAVLHTQGKELHSSPFCGSRGVSSTLRFSFPVRYVACSIFNLFEIFSANLDKKIRFISVPHKRVSNKNDYRGKIVNRL